MLFRGRVGVNGHALFGENELMVAQKPTIVEADCKLEDALCCLDRVVVGGEPTFVYM